MYDEPPTWNSGIDTMFLSPGSNVYTVSPLSVCAIKLACVSSTPLGRPVVPDEYMMMQTSSDSTSAGRSTGVADASSASYSSPSPPSGVTSMTCAMFVRSPRILSIIGLNSAPTNSTLASESLST